MKSCLSPTRVSQSPACARSELAPLALHAYPEAYVEFKRLLLLLLLLPQHRNHPQQQQQQHTEEAEAEGQQDRVTPQPNLTPPEAQEDLASGMLLMGFGGSGSSAAAVLCSSAGSAGLLDPESTSEFADLAYFTVRSLLGMQQPLLSLQLRFLLRLYGSYPASASTSGGALASELAPRLRGGGAGGGNRDPAPLPPLTAPGGGGGPPSFPESAMQAVIHGAGTSRQAATDAMKRHGGDALSAFKAEVGRLRLNEHLLAELALEYGTFRGLFSVQQVEALKKRAAVGGCGGEKAVVPERSPSSSAAAIATSSRDEDEHGLQRLIRNAQRLYKQQQQQQKRRGQGRYADSQQQQRQEQQYQQQGRNALSAAGSGRLLVATVSGPLGLARGIASREGASPPNKVARRSPPSEEDVGDDGNNEQMGDGTQQDDAEDEMEGDRQAAAAAMATSAPMEAAAGDGASSPEAVPASDSGSGSRSGSGSGSGGTQRLQGQEIISALLRLGQEGDADSVLALVEAADPHLWDEHPNLLFDVRRCQYGKLLAEGQITAALELARRELTPLANANPALLPLLKNAMAALLPPLPVGPRSPATADTAAAPPPLFRSLLPSASGASLPSAAPSSADASMMMVLGGATTATATAGSSSSNPSLLPSLPTVVGAIQAVLQPRLGLQGPRLLRLMEGLLASHRAWMKAERMTSDPFAEAMRINALRVTPPDIAATAAAAAALASQARQPSGAAGVGAAAAAAAARSSPPLPRPPPPSRPAREAELAVSLGATARALERALREAGADDRAVLQPWYEMEQQLLAQIALPFGRAELQGPGAPGAGGALFGIFGGGVPGLLPAEEEVQGGGEGGVGARVGGGAGRGMAPDDDDNSGEGMEVDEEGVLRLMEILELPRGAAVELLLNHDGDVQAAILSVMH
ncbi:hypothetical protein Vretifemale_12601 [Volvox reticuliferus]|uniref:CTLH/CRA C-terminal to LisH motif domain-containing protein n=2 Tax=Volvox reticuliferus TaxID=1737510 RepID=A0A8J4CRW7_9CHLO|nr:hypothetical protein Vretifemale_12601 [Volvox reticuliferus]